MFSFDAPSPTILICEENPDLATRFAAAALRAGLDPIVDPDRDPVTLASVHRPDAVLLSATLPQDARDVLAAINADPATEGTEVVVLVDAAEPRFEMECLAIGALDVRIRRVELSFFITLRSVLVRTAARAKTPWSAVASDVVRRAASPEQGTPTHGARPRTASREVPARSPRAVNV